MQNMVSQSAAGRRSSRGHELALRRLGYPVIIIGKPAHFDPAQPR